MTNAIDRQRGPLHRHRDGDNLFYEHPITKERFDSVTAALDVIESDALCSRWRPGLAAKTAMAELPKLIRATLTPPCGRTNSRCRTGTDGHDWRVRCADCPCDECELCVIHWLTYRHLSESRRRADEGSAVHDWIQDWVLSGGRDPGIDPALRPYIDTFLRFVADFGLTPDSWELSETTILNRADGWAGTLDAHLRFVAAATAAARKLCHKFGLARPVLTADVKTREKEEAAFYADMAKQLAAYERGEVILFDDGREEPLPATDGGLVIQLRPDGYGWRRVDTSDATYAAFLANLASWRWERDFGAQATQVKTFPDLDIPDLPPLAAPKKATTPRKTAAPKKAAPGAKARPVAERVLGLPRDGKPGNTLTDSDIPF